MNNKNRLIILGIGVIISLMAVTLFLVLFVQGNKAPVEMSEEEINEKVAAYNKVDYREHVPLEYVKELEIVELDEERLLIRFFMDEMLKELPTYQTLWVWEKGAWNIIEATSTHRPIVWGNKDGENHFLIWNFNQEHLQWQEGVELSLEMYFIQKRNYSSSYNTIYTYDPHVQFLVELELEHSTGILKLPSEWQYMISQIGYQGGDESSSVADFDSLYSMITYHVFNEQDQAIGFDLLESKTNPTFINNADYHFFEINFTHFTDIEQWHRDNNYESGIYERRE